jgi:membrane associated rhomboid family serine protease
MSDSDSDKLPIKVLIVIFVFPTFAWLTQFLAGFVLAGLMLLLPRSAQDMGLPVIKWVTTIMGFLGGFLISRMIWPREPETSNRTNFAS